MTTDVELMREAVFFPANDSGAVVPMVIIAGCTIAAFVDEHEGGLRLCVSIGTHNADQMLIRDENTDDESVRLRVDVDMERVFTG